MKNLYPLLFTFFTVVAFGQKHKNTIGFIENKGQIVDQKGKSNPSVQYLLNTPGLNVQLRNHGFSYDVYEVKKIPLSKKQKATHRSALDKDTPAMDSTFEYHYHRIDIDFLNCKSDVRIISDEKSTDYDNYYNVAHAPGGITNVHKFQKVTYQNIYNNIDVVFFIPKDVSKAVEYNFVVKPGGKISDIQLQFKGAETELVDNKIKMDVRFGQMEETLPLSWIENGKDRKEIAVGYKQIKKGIYGFEGDVNASGKTIVIDPTPVRLWGTYYGGIGDDDSTTSMCTDGNGNIWITGQTLSQDNIATAGTYLPTTYDYIPWAAFAAKFNSSGQRIWGTFVFSHQGEHNTMGNIGINGAALNSMNEFYVIGHNAITHTNINNLATPGAYQVNTNANTYDGFIIKLNTNGQRIWGTYFGGEGDDLIKSINLDSQENIVIAGRTNSNSNIATPNTYLTNVNTITPFGTVGFFAKFNPLGQIIYSSYFQGEIRNGTIDKNDNILLVGQYQIDSNYPDIATSGSHQTQNFNKDGFVVKFDTNGNRLWCTYYGGNLPSGGNDVYSDIISDIDTDELNNIYISGHTNSLNNISTPGAFKETIVSGDVNVFAAKFNAQGLRLWGTYFGDNFLGIPKIEKCYDSYVTDNGTVYIVGETNSSNNIATSNSFQNLIGGQNDGFMTKFDTTGQRVWGSYYGGVDKDFCQNVHYKNGNLYISGRTTSPNLATPGTHKQVVEQTDLFLAKFSDCEIVLTAVSNSPICIGSTIELHATGGTAYSWTGPNNFTSIDQNPVISNASSLHNGEYTCIVTGNGDCDGPVSITIAVGDTTSPVADINPLSTISGDCNTVVTAPTATDNCAGTINATTTDPLSYAIAGNYTIHWNYNDGNGNTSTQNQSVVITATALPTSSSPQNFCIQQNATLNSIAITGQNIKWYDALTLGNLLPTTTVLQNGVTYYASQTVSGCESARVSVTVNVQSTPTPTGDQNPSFCTTQNPTLADVIVTGTGVQWYANAIGTSVLPATTVLANGSTYYATQTVNGCESVNRLAVTTTLINTLNATNYSEFLCDDLDDGTETVDLTTYNSKLISNTAGCTFSYYSSSLGAENQTTTEQISNNCTLSIGLKIIYVRIESSNGCHQIVELQLTLVKKPVITITDIMPICEGTSITVDAGLGYDGYLWSTNETTSSIEINSPGNYSVTVDEFHGTLKCSSVKNFSVVKSNVATISEVITSDWTDNENTITAMLTGSSVGDYVYSLDGITYQSSNTFSGLESGEYNVYVKDKNGCGIQSEEFYLLMYPKFFTPNGDGFHDTWQIKFSDNEPHLKVQLFDRFGKFIKELDNTAGWNGTFNNQELPATDYWFVVTRANGKEYKGHFALKR